MTSCGGAGIIVADVVDAPGIGLPDGGDQDLRDILHVAAAEDLPRLDDAPRGAGPNLGEGSAPGSVDPGQPKDMERQAMVAMKRLPFGFCRDAGAPRAVEGVSGVSSSTQPPPWSP
jgi:hypothetical protein